MGVATSWKAAAGAWGSLTGPLMFTALVDEYVQTPDASFVILPTNVVFGGVLPKVHNLAEYKTHGHWRHADLSKGEDQPAETIDGGRSHPHS